MSHGRIKLFHGISHSSVTKFCLMLSPK